VSIEFSPDGRLLLSHCWPPDDKGGYLLRVLDTNNGQIVPVWSDIVTRGLVNSFSADGKALAIFGVENKLQLREAPTGCEMMIDSVTRELFSGWRGLNAEWKGTITVYDVMTGSKILNFVSHQARVQDARLSPDGTLIATAGWDYTVKLWNARTGHELHTLKGHGSSVYAVAFSPDGKRLASSGEDQTVRVWDTKTGLELLKLKGHTRPVKALAFSPDGMMLASGGMDKTVRLWRTASDVVTQAQTK